MSRILIFIHILSIILANTDAKRRNGISRGHENQSVPRRNQTRAETLSSLPARRVINGRPANPGEFPYIGYLQYGIDIFCAATIIHQRWALTAGHCYDSELDEDKQKKTHLVVGTNRLNGYDGKHYEVEHFLVHPDFRHIEKEMNGGLEFLVNDIALLHLKKDIHFNDRVKPVMLPTGAWYSHENEWAAVIGWGKTDFNVHLYNEELLRTDVQIITQEECQEIWTYLMDNQICSSSRLNAGGCEGDSGGPMMINGIQVGIISTGDSECGTSMPHLYARVSSHIHWIRKHLLQYRDHI